MFSFGSNFLASVYTLLLKILSLIYKHVYRSQSSLAEEKGSNCVSQLGDEFVFPPQGSDAKESLNLQSCRDDFNATQECSSALVSKSSKYQILSDFNVSGFVEEPNTVKFVVQEMFVGSEDHIIGSEMMKLEQNLEENQKEFDDEDEDEETESSPFYFKLLNPSLPTIGDTQEILPQIDLFSEGDEGKDSLLRVNGEDKEEISDFRVVEDEDFSYEIELIPTTHLSSIHEMCMGVDSLAGVCSEEEEEDIVYEIELIPTTHSTSNLAADQESDTKEILKKIEENDSGNWMTTFLDEHDHTKSSYDLQNDDTIDDDKQEVKGLDDEFIELEPSSCADDASNNKYDVEEDNHDDDVLSQHQNLVQQMKMELKNCRIGGLPTISEESETPKIIEDLRPLQIDHKIGYKEVMERIHSFYKSYAEKMRKLDILNYQTSQAISFLQLKDSQACTAGKKQGNANLPKILGGKVRRVYADPMMNKSIIEMQRDLELVYVGQVCLSWEILWWLDARACELIQYDEEARRSYNRAAEELQQFQVLLQRFMEDELFQGRRHDNYVRNRCLIRSFLQVPSIRDDCLKADKEEREERDKITLEMLVEILTETILIFQEFVFADKNVTSSALTKVAPQQNGSSELLSEVISSLEKKGRRMKEQMRSQKCIVKKMRKHQERERDREMLAAQIDLRLIRRVLNMERLSGEQLIWCREKLHNLSFVGRKLRRESCFLLFPC